MSRRGAKQCSVKKNAAEQSGISSALSLEDRGRFQSIGFTLKCSEGPQRMSDLKSSVGVSRSHAATLNAPQLDLPHV